MRFLAVGDVHYESSASKFFDNHTDLVSQTLKDIWRYALESNISDVILLGDIFETPFPKDETKKAFLKALSNKLNYHIILGNHDIATLQNNSLLLLKYFIQDLGLADNIKFYFEPSEVLIQGVKFNMLPFPHKQPVSPAPCICVGHFETKGSLADNGRAFKDGVELDEKYDWILGHLHCQQGKVYPGSVVQTKFGEPTNKYFFDCSYTNDKGLSIKKVNIDTPFKLIDLKISSLDDLKGLCVDNCYRIYAPKHLDLNEINKLVQGYKIHSITGCDVINKEVKVTELDLAFQEQDITDEVVYLGRWLSNPSNTSLNQEQIEQAIDIVQDIKTGKASRVVA